MVLVGLIFAVVFEGLSLLFLCRLKECDHDDILKKPFWVVLVSSKMNKCARVFF